MSTKRFLLQEARQIAEQAHPYSRPVESILEAYRILDKQPKSDFWLKVKAYFLKHNIHPTNAKPRQRVYTIGEDNN